VSRPTVALVREFHQAFQRTIPNAPEIRGPESKDWLLEHAATELQTLRGLLRRFGEHDWRVQRVALIAEELAELACSLSERDLEGTLDALIDIEYVTAGGFLDFGLSQIYDAARQRIHDANMSKLGPDGQPIVDEAGKIVKGPNYVKAQLGDLVRP
jgi:predicted HAD superfamily Cof-like phosphohydrolase